MGRTLHYALAVALLLFAAVAVLSYRNTTRLIAAGQDVVRTQAQVDEFDSLMLTLVDAETGQRGFIITGDTAFLDPYNSAQNEVAVRLYEISVTASDTEQTLVRELNRLVRQKMDYFETTITVRREKGFNAAMQMVATRTGKQSMDEVRHVLGQLKAREVSELRLRTAAAELSAKRTLASSIALMLSCAGLVVGAYSFAVRDSRRRRTAERESLLAREKTDMWAKQMENTTKEITFINGFNDTLQVCFSAGEAYQAIASYVEFLFPAIHGSLGVINNSRNLIDIVASWNPPDMANKSTHLTIVTRCVPAEPTSGKAGL